MESYDPFVEKHLKKVKELQAKYALQAEQSKKPAISDDAVMGMILGFGMGMIWALVGLAIL